MKDIDLDDILKKIGKLSDVDEDWYEIGDAEKGEDGETRYGVFAKNDEIAEKVQKVLDQIIFENAFKVK